MARVTIEDCLHTIPNPFALVMIAAQRARQILEGDDPNTMRHNAAPVLALRDIASGYIGTDLPCQLIRR